MFTEERQRIIIEKLKDSGRVEVTELSDYFDVSVDTIRRDLKCLEELGRLRKTHGGAILMKMSGPHPQMKDRSKVNSVLKESIAGKVADFVEPGDSILLDGSSSVLAAVSSFSHIKDLSIFTTSPAIACAMMDNHCECRLELIGGVLRKGADNATGFDAVKSIEELHVDKVIMGVCGLSSSGHLSTFNPDEAPIHKAMIRAGQQIILLMDSTKWDQSYIKDLGEIPSNCQIISDGNLPDYIENTLKSALEREIAIYRVK